MHDAMPIAEKKIGPFLLQHQAQFGLNPALKLFHINVSMQYYLFYVELRSTQVWKFRRRQAESVSIWPPRGYTFVRFVGLAEDFQEKLSPLCIHRNQIIEWFNVLWNCGQAGFCSLGGVKRGMFLFLSFFSSLHFDCASISL
jgi:hypothetical protein